jgi:hypothetical protein
VFKSTGANLLLQKLVSVLLDVTTTLVTFVLFCVVTMVVLTHPNFIFVTHNLYVVQGLSRAGERSRYSD